MSDVPIGCCVGMLGPQLVALCIFMEPLEVKDLLEDGHCWGWVFILNILAHFLCVLRFQTMGAT